MKRSVRITTPYPTSDEVAESLGIKGKHRKDLEAIVQRSRVTPAKDGKAARAVSAKKTLKKLAASLWKHRTKPRPMAEADQSEAKKVG